MDNQFHWNFTTVWNFTDDELANFLIEMHEAKKQRSNLFVGAPEPVTVELKPLPEITWSELIK